VKTLRERPTLLLVVGAALAVTVFSFWITPDNPPGFHRDEAALALNAHTLSTDLRDEDGARLPLFFRSFDDYKSPVFPYALAAVFKVTGASQTVARGLSAVLVLAAVLLRVCSPGGSRATRSSPHSCCSRPASPRGCSSSGAWRSRHRRSRSCSSSSC
jgi:hypothetical protein